MCYKKGTRTVSAGDVDVIRDYIIDGYSTTDSDFPNGICTGCSLSLSKKRKNPDLFIPNVNDEYDPERKHGLRSTATSICDCRICKVARQSGLQDHHARKKRAKPGRPSSKQTPETYKVCGKCFTKLYRGCSHSSFQCYSRRSKVNNIVDIASPSSLARAASRVDHVEESGNPLGRPKNSEEVRKELFTANDIYGIGKDLQLSSLGMKTLAQDIGVATGSRKIIEKDVMTIIQQKNHQVDEYFEIKSLMFRNKDKVTKIEQNFKQETIICNDVSKFVDEILERRDREWVDSLLLRIGIDGGVFKVCLSIFDKDDPFPCIKSNLSKKLKESGVRNWQ